MDDVHRSAYGSFNGRNSRCSTTFRHGGLGEDNFLSGDTHARNTKQRDQASLGGSQRDQSTKPLEATHEVVGRTYPGISGVTGSLLPS
jgi:hypothetical protein